VQALSHPVVLGIWDTAGSERYEAMSRLYYRDAWAALLCYDVTSRDSWARVLFWADELRKNEPGARLYFVGTKQDLVVNDVHAKQVRCVWCVCVCIE
jgi:Ras-related protein Rab-24